MEDAEKDGEDLFHVIKRIIPTFLLVYNIFSERTFNIYRAAG